MDMMDPMESGQDQKDGECESPTASEAAMVAAETCLVVDGDLNIVSEEQEEVPAAAVIQRHQPVVVAAGTKRTRQNRRNVILQQATMENATLVESDPFEAVGDSGGTVTYRVVQVSAPGSGSEEMDNISQIIHPATNFTTGATASGVQAVLTSPINGQFYVIGSPQEVFTGTNTRNIAPRNQSETVRGTTRRDERRRATHNEVERRRRDKINSWIMKLGKIIPDCGNESGKQGQVSFEGQSKGGILAKACEYIQELRSNNQRMTENMKENERLAMQVEALRQQNEELRREKLALHNQLTQNGIVPLVEADATPVIIVDQDPLS